MKIAELEINIMAVPQGYYLAQGISRDLNFKVGLPAVFEKTYNLKEKLTDKYDEIECGETYLIDNVYSLVVKDSSYDSPDRDLLMEALVNLRDQMEENKVTKLAIPRLCCGSNDWICFRRCGYSDSCLCAIGGNYGREITSLPCYGNNKQ